MYNLVRLTQDDVARFYLYVYRLSRHPESKRFWTLQLLSDDCSQEFLQYGYDWDIALFLEDAIESTI
jgi:hypothetical protein